MRKFNCIIIDPILDTRMRLKQATASVSEFGQVIQAPSTDEAIRQLKGTTLIDVVFVTGKLEQNAFAEFVTEAKKTKQGEDAAYVLVLKSQTESGSDIAQMMMSGADGILCEPYSVDTLVSITHLAARVRKERWEAREKMAMGLIVTDAINQLDLVALLKASGCEPGTSIRALRDLGTKISAISPEMRDIYYDAVVEQFSVLPPPKNAFKTKLYGGASSRVKQHMERRLLSELQSGRKK